MKITRALISVSDKEGIIDLVKALKQFDIEILSTGGTYSLIKEQGYEVKEVSSHTGFPEIMDGRVKTLHPKIHGGILAARNDDAHIKAMQENDITPIDLIIVNLYPFEETVAKGGSYEEIIEKIDIGGPSMVRSAAKNHAFTTIVTDPSDYQDVINHLNENKGETKLEFRKKMAAKAFAKTANYDAAISQWFLSLEKEAVMPQSFTFSGRIKQSLRYGENSHQQAALYQTSNKGLLAANQIQGKELSYNNINDTDAALKLVTSFKIPAAAIIKHANPCGVACAGSVEEAYEKALSCDPVSAFGGIFVFNQKVTKVLAEKLAKIFLEVVAAPDFDKEALEIFAAKKNIRVLQIKDPESFNDRQLEIKTITGGFLLQEGDLGTISQEDLKVVTDKAPTADQIEEMLFAFNVCKYVKSNAIVLTKNKATIGIGAGQMSRVDSSRIAALKAADGDGNQERAKGSTLASDAFFPFADGVIQAAEAGVTAIIQPGGSMRDEEVIEAANKYGIAMVFTGKRHFKH